MLTKHEFKHFIFPQLSSEGSASVLVPEALEDLDEDGDGMVDLEEFLAVHEARFPIPFGASWCRLRYHTPFLCCVNTSPFHV